MTCSLPSCPHTFKPSKYMPEQRFCSGGCGQKAWLAAYEKENGVEYHAQYSRDRRAIRGEFEGLCEREGD